MIIIHNKPSEDFVKEVTPKTMIVLHYTAGGTLSGAEASLAIRDYVNVHYGIDDNGMVYRYFDERYWAYHTGTNQRDAKSSIGIEIRNWGHLKRIKNQLVSWTGKAVPWEKVVKCAPFRGYEYWEKLTDPQVDSLKDLIMMISGRHPITRIVTHAQLKPTKLDYPPDFPQLQGLLYG
jgi:N-acetyl-anhydromuramyl-L-alanine amidase AmpD